MLHRNDFGLPDTMRLLDKGQSPLRPLASSYGLAGIAAVIAAFAGIGLWPSILICWLGGAATTVAFGMIKAGSKSIPTGWRLSPKLS